VAYCLALHAGIKAQHRNEYTEGVMQKGNDLLRIGLGRKSTVARLQTSMTILRKRSTHESRKTGGTKEDQPQFSAKALFREALHGCD
jgi:hypothetical protein